MSSFFLVLLSPFEVALRLPVFSEQVPFLDCYVSAAFWTELFPFPASTFFLVLLRAFEVQASMFLRVFEVFQFPPSL